MIGRGTVIALAAGGLLALALSAPSAHDPARLSGDNGPFDPFDPFTEGIW